MKNYSQAYQDVFVLECLDYKRDGKFLDLGCNDPIEISNTYLLEKEYGWTGTCIDIDSKMINKFIGLRGCRALSHDCTRIEEIDLGCSHFDYLSLDLEPAQVTLSCLKKIPFNSISFSVITFEHDQYRFGSSIKDESRQIFKDAGYTLLCADVHNKQKIYNFEDWYINENFVSLEKVKFLSCEGLIDLEIRKKFKTWIE